MPITVDQVLALAPDASSATAGRKLGTPRDWKNLGVNDVAVWGDCQGSALYGVQVDLSDFTSKCSCPSRKFPCKHALGLLLLHAGGQVPTVADAPERVTTWLGGRAERAAKKAEVKEVTPEQVAKKAARAEAKLADLGEAMAPFALWLDDVARAGIGSLQQRTTRSLAHEAARLVDVGAPGLAARVRDVAEDVGRGEGWEEAVLAGLGELRLITRALTRIDTLPDDVRTELRSLVGVPLTADEVRQHGPRDTGTWVVAGTRTRTDPTGLRARRTWLVRVDDPHIHAVQLDFAPGAMPLPAGPPPGQVFHGTLARWPGASQQRALVVDRADAPHAAPRGAAIPDALDAAAATFARAPLTHTVLLVLADVTVGTGRTFFVRDGTGASLPLPELPELLLAVAGSAPMTLAGEWDGHVFVPLAAWLAERVLPLDVSSDPPRRSPALRLLTQTALLGGDGALPSTPVDAIVPETPRPERLLLTAGTLDAWARAGARTVVSEPLEPCPEDPTPAAPDGVRDVLAMVDGGTPHPVALELYRRLARRGLRLPDAELPASLRRGHGEAVRPLLGARGRWLASLRPYSWAWAVADRPAEDVESIPEPARRRIALRALRQEDPQAARAILGRLLATEKADRRVELLTDLVGLVTPDDLPLLATLDADRSSSVRDVVDALRLSLGVDAHGDAVRRRVAAALVVAAPTGLSWLASKVTGAAPTLTVTLPPAEDPTWEADGLPTLPHAPGKPTTGLDRLVWLLRRIPPTEHTRRTQLSPTALLTALPADMPELVHALVDATTRERDIGWIDALCGDTRAAGQRSVLLAALPRDLLLARLLAALRDPKASFDTLLDVWGAGILPRDVATALVARVRAAPPATNDSASYHARLALRTHRLVDVPDPLLASVTDLLPDTPSIHTHHAARLRLAAVLPEP